MNVRSGFQILSFVVACARTPVAARAPETCPSIAPAGSAYPTTTYHTLVLDGKVMYARRAQRNTGSHSSMPVAYTAADSIVDSRVAKVRIKETRILKGHSARIYEACPGVPVIVIVSARRHWWWPS